jgi:hypothetical protein
MRRLKGQPSLPEAFTHATPRPVCAGAWVDSRGIHFPNVPLDAHPICKLPVSHGWLDVLAHFDQLGDIHHEPMAWIDPNDADHLLVLEDKSRLERRSYDMTFSRTIHWRPSGSVMRLTWALSASAESSSIYVHPPAKPALASRRSAVPSDLSGRSRLLPMREQLPPIPQRSDARRPRFRQHVIDHGSRRSANDDVHAAANRLPQRDELARGLRRHERRNDT